MATCGSRVGLGLGVLGLAVSVVLGRGEARAACGGPGLTLWWPPPGATLVPTDTTLVFGASEGEQPLAGPGGAVALETVWSFQRSPGECESTLYVKRSTEPLDAQTTYELAPGTEASRSWPPFDVERVFTTGGGTAGALPAVAPGLHLYLVDSGYGDGSMGGDSSGHYTGYAIVRTEEPAVGTVLVTGRAPTGDGGERRAFLVTPNPQQRTDLYLPVLLDGRPCVRVEVWTVEGALLQTEDLCEPTLCAPKPKDDGEWAVDWSQVPAGSCAGVPVGVPFTEAGEEQGDGPAGDASPGGAPQGDATGEEGCAASPAVSAPAWLLLALPWLAHRNFRRRTR